jgi:hypothetical protein
MRAARGATIAALLFFGLYAVGDAVSVGVALVVAGVALVTLWPYSSSGVVVSVVRAIGALLVPFLVMVGVAVLLGQEADLIRRIHVLRDLKVPIAVGLAVALVAFAAAAYWYLGRTDWGARRSALIAIELAAVVVLVLPYALGRLNSDNQVASARPVPSRIDVLIVGDGSSHPVVEEPPPSPALNEFDVTYSIGYADGNRVRWTLVNDRDPAAALAALAEGDQRPTAPGGPTTRPDADPVLLLYPDGTPPVVTGDPAQLTDVPGREGEVDHWRRVARSVSLGTDKRLPTFALLQTTAKPRLAEWRDFAPPNGPVSVQALGSQTAVDAAVRLAIAAPTAEQELALATQYRPILLFDRRETVPRPLSIAALFNEDRIRLCHDDGFTSSCEEPSSDPRLLENGNTHLRLELPEAEQLHVLAVKEATAARAGGVEAVEETGNAAQRTLPEGLPPSAAVAGVARTVGSQSAIYVHPTLVKHEQRLYLDYWWYLPYNPVKLGGGALCGAGLVIADVTCLNHQSDWEGVTVVVDLSESVPKPLAVQYAQHSHVVLYPWSQLQRDWEGNEEVEGRIEGMGETASRPLVFVAVGTHASYPLPCRNGCRQVADTDLPEEPHLGDLPWSGDYTSACGASSCLQLLPTHDGGKEPALWNGYEGTWGELHCFLTYYCDSAKPPQSPGTQGRYEHPGRISGYAEADGEFHEGAWPG